MTERTLSSGAGRPANPLSAPGFSSTPRLPVSGVLWLSVLPKPMVLKWSTVSPPAGRSPTHRSSDEARICSIRVAVGSREAPAGRTCQKGGLPHPRSLQFTPDCHFGNGNGIAQPATSALPSRSPHPHPCMCCRSFKQGAFLGRARVHPAGPPLSY